MTARAKVLAGMTTVEEVLAATQEDVAVESLPPVALASVALGERAVGAA